MISSARHIFFAAVAGLLLLTGCGGAGGGNAGPNRPGPPAISGAAAALFDGLSDGQNLAEISFAADTDSGQITVFEDRAGLAGFLAKQPDPSRFIQTGPLIQQARLVFIPAQQGAANQGNQAITGRYLLWGKQLTVPPASGAVRYAVSGSFACPGCQRKNGALSGEMQISFATGRTQISLTGQGFTFRTEAEIGKNGRLSVLANHLPSLSLDGQSQSLAGYRLQGGIFGSGAEAAGLIFGLDSAKGPVTGAVLGSRDP